MLQFIILDLHVMQYKLQYSYYFVLYRHLLRLLSNLFL